ncbi:2340_t:CDS:2 [Paraglomus occultum]|uniref:allantoinase n=1 Tax=Paraglomus occultum TaxID=144539 RepID=A0A9N9F6B8_9GLOM|nr:2340_t:CDS:2 [Paraglomus occultum]
MALDDLFIITSNKVLALDSSLPSPATIEISKKNGHIVNVIPTKLSLKDYPSLAPTEFIDAGDDVVMPGIVDAHVHLNDPGRTAWEGFESGTKAAAAGGVTTVIEMPLNSIPPTTTVANFDIKRQTATGRCWVDVGFYGGIIPGNQNEIVPLIKAGVRGFKCFLIESGVDEFPCVNETDARRAFEKLQSQNTVFMFHAEMSNGEQADDNEQIESQNYQRFLLSRPPSLELNAIKLIVQLTNEYKTVPTHIVHLSTADALDIIKKAKDDGLPLTVETCFHYLCLSAEDIPAGHTEFKCCPPIRNEANRQKLWQALKDGIIDDVVSDHSPCTANLKRFDEGDFINAWGGISTLQFGLPVLWTEAKKHGCNINDLVKWLSRSPAKRVSLDDRKGAIKKGYDADIVIWNPEETFTVTRDIIQFKNKFTPYIHRTLHGVVKKTILRGNVIYDSSHGVIGDPKGQLLI